MLRREIRQPLEYTTHAVRRYDDLVTSKADAEIDELVSRSPSFDEYGQELRRYAAILDDINYNTVKVTRIGMFEVRPSALRRASNEPSQIRSKQICFEA